MKLRFIIAASLAALPLLGGCAITTTPLASIGPNPMGRAGHGPAGYLVV